METRATRIGLGVWVALVLVFLYIPIAVICLYAFNASNVQSWPIAGLTSRWFGSAIHNGDMQQALWLSLKAAVLATTIALPGIVTGMALNSYFTFWKFNLISGSGG